MAEIWTDWENLVINGVFPLRRFLTRSNHSVVFLTETRDHADAAIKIIPADPATAPAQVAHLKRVATLAHPHLIHLVEVGQCRLGGHPFLFVVMEQAEQSLDQILPHRALTADEVRELLPPTLEALSFLHRSGLVHGQLKPANFLVVNDQLKLSSDTARAVDPLRASDTASGAVSASAAAAPGPTDLYDAPEVARGKISPAGDVWSLGISLVEALSQRAAQWPDAESAVAALPRDIPGEIVDTVRRCLNPDPARRATIAELQKRFSPSSAALAPRPEALAPRPEALAPRPEALAPRSEATLAPNSPRSHREAPALVPSVQELLRKRGAQIALIAGFLVIVAVIAFGARRGVQRSSPAAEPPAASSTQAASDGQTIPAAPPTALPAQRPAPPSPPAPAVLHEEAPDVSRGALASIRGHIKVAVRVTVDRSGNVVAVSVKEHGSSNYFARAATTAAKKWKFSPAASRGSRDWLLRFEFSRAGVADHAVPQF
ncbi:MAG TPA: TonB family protein [Steroidobacteraceae bacterium]|nr:TonB family protein [Steroidobacteraceae bacterium]